MTHSHAATDAPRYPMARRAGRLLAFAMALSLAIAGALMSQAQHVGASHTPDHDHVHFVCSQSGHSTADAHLYPEVALTLGRECLNVRVRAQYYDNHSGNLIWTNWDEGMSYQSYVHAPDNVAFLKGQHCARPINQAHLNWYCTTTQL